MHIIPFKGRNPSSHYHLNLLYQSCKSFLMDNHLAASWCWLQIIDIKKKYNLLHIDRHYDLLQSQIDWWIETLEEQNIDFKKISIADLQKVLFCPKDMPLADSNPLLRWDNYLTIFNRLYPNVITSTIFATHKDGDTMEELVIEEREIYELPENLSHWLTNVSEVKWIVNLDIDYFFIDYNGRLFQFLSDEYVLKIAHEIKKSWENIAVFTIALSPELCGGWEPAVRVAKLVTDYLEIPWEE